MSYFVSVVVPTCRRPQLLARCLSALLSQDYEPCEYEILVVDDASDPETQAIVEEINQSYENHPEPENRNYPLDQKSQDGAVSSMLKADIQPGFHLSLDNRPRIRYIPVNGPHGPSAARNCGWKAAEGEIIAFTDDDCIPWPTWIRAGVSAFQEDTVGVSGQVIVPIPATPSDYELDTQGLERSDFVTANCFYLKKALEEVGGFDEQFRIAWREDSDLYFTMLERGYRLINGPTAIVVHPVRPAKWGVSLKQQRKCMYNALLFKKHPDLYRKKVQSNPPLRYYTITVLLLIGLLGAGLGIYWLGFGCILAWLIITVELFEKRIEHTTHSFKHLMEMLFTSALIPPLAVYWRIRGAITFRTVFF